jgi:glycosyltransferase involved in cell wall biosynthesis
MTREKRALSVGHCNPNTNMRILVVTNLYPPHYVGGYELRCRDITKALHQRGHQVQVLTSNHSVANATENNASDYVVERSLRVHGFFGHPWLGIRDLRALEQHNNATLTSAIAAFKPDIVHVWNLGGLSKSLALTLQRLGIPTVFDVSDHWIARSLAADVWLDWWNRERASVSARVARGFWSATGRREAWHQGAPTNPAHHLHFQRIYFCSHRLREITAQAGYDVQHAEVIHCPVDTSTFHGAVKSSTRPMKKLLYAGRLSEDKGIFTALQAMRIVKDQLDVTLHVYGKGDPEYVSMLKGYVAAYVLPVTFHSAAPEEMPEVYRRHDALLFTSEWEEPFALTPLEAMASGLPVIGTMTGGSAELFEHCKNALTYNAGNGLQLAQNIVRLANDSALREQIAAQGQTQVRKHFKLTNIVAQIERYLDESLRDWHQPRLPHYLAA